MNYDQLTLLEKKQHLEDSIQKQPYLADAYNDLAWIYFLENEKLLQALDFINIALFYDQENVAYLDTKFKLLSKMGRENEAKLVFDKLQGMNFEKMYK